MTVVGAVRSASLSDFAWAVWPFAAWGLPVFLVLSGFIAESGGWESLLLLVASPVLVPAAGLLGMLPRSLLRRKGVTSAPAPVAALLFVHWWSWIAFIFTLPGTGDFGPVRSLLRTGMRAALSQPTEQFIFFGGLLLAAVTWLGILGLATSAEPGVGAEPSAGWVRTAWITAVAAPALLALAVGAAIFVTSQQRDAAGDTVAAVGQQAIAVQADRAAERNDTVHARLTSVRGAIAETGWGVQTGGLTNYDPRCARLAAECYGLDATYTNDVVPTDVDPADLAEILRAEGWDATDDAGRVSATHPDGYELSVDLYAGGTWIELYTPTWWGDPAEISRELDARAPAAGERPDSYAFDEWPPLR